MRVLIVEDERSLAQALEQLMLEEKYQVDTVFDGADGLSYALLSSYDIIILDVMLPKLDGFAVVKRLRSEKRATPVLMLTARGELSSKVMGLDCGADDYMTKPFAPQELLARVRALARRQGEVLLEEQVLFDLSLSLSAHSLCCGERSVKLGHKEFEIMRILMSSKGVIVSKEDLITKVWGTDSDAEDNNVEAYISFLRKKLLFLGSHVSIGTIRKVGYRLEDEDD